MGVAGLDGFLKKFAVYSLQTARDEPSAISFMPSHVCAIDVFEFSDDYKDAYMGHPHRGI